MAKGKKGPFRQFLEQDVHNIDLSPTDLCVGAGLKSTAKNKKNASNARTNFKMALNSGAFSYPVATPQIQAPQNGVTAPIGSDLKLNFEISQNGNTVKVTGDGVQIGKKILNWSLLRQLAEI